jgi:hypothetical protein
MSATTREEYVKRVVLRQVGGVAFEKFRRVKARVGNQGMDAWVTNR